MAVLSLLALGLIAVTEALPKCRCARNWRSAEDGGSCWKKQNYCTEDCSEGGYDPWCIIEHSFLNDDGEYECEGEEQSEGGGWIYCDPKDYPVYETSSPKQCECADKWTAPSDKCFDEQSGCPKDACDGDEKPWCMLAEQPQCVGEDTRGGWRYCTPNTPFPTARPSVMPTRTPTVMPTRTPTRTPSLKPTPSPTFEPTAEPTYEPTHQPTHYPYWQPTPEPTVASTPEPTGQPTVEPSPAPTAAPVDPTPAPTPLEEEATFDEFMMVCNWSKAENDKKDCGAFCGAKFKGKSGCKKPKSSKKIKCKLLNAEQCIRADCSGIKLAGKQKQFKKCGGKSQLD